MLIGLISGLSFISAENAVKAVLCLISSSISLASLCFFLRAEFLGCIYLVVFIGAVLVLFLFVIMMISISDTSSSFSSLTSVGVLIFGIFFSLLLYKFINLGSIAVVAIFKNQISSAEFILSVSNLMLFNFGLFTGFLSTALIAVAFLLFVSMIGCIAVTLQDFSNRKTQSIFSQKQRKPTLFALNY